MSKEQFESSMIQATELLKSNKFDQAILLYEQIYFAKDTPDDPFIKIWPLGGIVSGYIFKYKENESLLSPESAKYRELRDYLILLFQNYEMLDSEQKLHYEKSNQLFHLLPSLLNLMKNNKNLSELDAGKKEVNEKSGCFIATEVYGSIGSPQVMALQGFRDNYLNQLWIGKAFIKLYYKVSPIIALWLHQNEVYRNYLRTFILDKIVKFIPKK